MNDGDNTTSRADELRAIARDPKLTDGEREAAAAELHRLESTPAAAADSAAAMAAEADAAEAELARLEKTKAAEGEEEPRLLFSREVSLPVPKEGEKEGTVKHAFRLRMFSEEGSLVLHVADRPHGADKYGEPITIFYEDGRFREDSESAEFFERWDDGTRRELVKYTILQLQRLEGRPRAVIR